MQHSTFVAAALLLAATVGGCASSPSYGYRYGYAPRAYGYSGYYTGYPAGYPYQYQPYYSPDYNTSFGTYGMAGSGGNG